MSAISRDATIEEILAAIPPATRVFDAYGIDYCCGGKATLESVCKLKGIDPSAILEMITRKPEAPGNAEDSGKSDSRTLTELTDEIESICHNVLWKEVDRLDALSAKVVKVHGDRDPKLALIRKEFLEFAHDVSEHMITEERVLFPLLRKMDAAGPAAFSHSGSVAQPIRKMVSAHAKAETTLDRIRGLSEAYSPPSHACSSYRSLFSGLERLEKDFGNHLRLENEILFPKAIAMEEAKDRTSLNAKPIEN